MTITKFEEIKAWQEARILVKMVYELTDEGRFARDFGLRDQMRRAAVSVMANIAEGFDCGSTIEFSRFLGIARRSAAEVQSLLYAALDVGYITQEQFQVFYQQAGKAKGFIGAFKNAMPKHR